MQTVPCTLEQANSFVRRFHRHHKPVLGARFSIAAADDTGVVRGVVIVGRPVSRHMDDKWTMEVTRLCTDGTANACSLLYGAAWRAARAMGYQRIITYTLPAEGGTSLHAVGWRKVAETPGNSWSVPSRPRKDSHPLGVKWRWEQGTAYETVILDWQDSSEQFPQLWGA